MSSSYRNDALPVKRNIVEVVSLYIPLRKAGKEYVGSCPFHAAKTPSLIVNEEKGVFHCFGCGAGGDVIRFVQLAEGCSFREALSHLGIEPGPRGAVPSRKRRAAEKIVGWVNQQRERLNARIRELDEQIELADEIPDPELAESLWRDRRLVADLRDDLGRFEYLPDFIQMKSIIEHITARWL